MKLVFSIFLIINALFWGFAPEETKNNVLSFYDFNYTHPEWVYVYIISLGCFALALLIYNGCAGFNDFLMDLFNNVKNLLTKNST
jgi:hypothetical protein|tara:strand:- start:2607 stop:2861 length:255 start_codon:yes stop_codon:yes gene_type:complete